MSSVQSPCVRNCCLNEQDVCLGCFRSLEEIKAWQRMSLTERADVLAAAQQRQLAQSLSATALSDIVSTLGSRTRVNKAVD